MQRRDFIFQSASMLLAWGLSPALFAKTMPLLTDDEFFLQITIPNGWDVTMATEPWVGSKRPDAAELFLGYSENDMDKVGRIPIGPALRPLKPYLSRLAILNGIFVSKTSVDHVALRNYVVTGSGTSTKPLAAIAYLVRQPSSAHWGLLTNAPVPSGDATIVKSSIEGLATLATTNGKIFQVTNAKPTPLQSGVDHYLKGLPLEKIYFAALKNKSKDREILRAQVIAAAFKSRLARGAALSIEPTSKFYSLDTHTDHDKNHLASLTDVFRQVAGVLKELEKTEISRGVSLLDRTTVFITSEFSRSPSLNNSRGKEHNAFTNSALLMGPRIAGGQTLGGSKLILKANTIQNESLHVAQYINPKSGQAILDPADIGQGVLMKPETVIANLFMAAGLDRGRLDSELQSQAKLETLFRST